MPELLYPITMEYMDHVDDQAWFIVRELVTNALDEDPNFTINLSGDVLTIRSLGEGLAIRHLLLGVSEKKENAVGQFGEGLKLALLMLTRMGLRAEIRSGTRILWNEPATLEGEDVFKIVWENGKEETFETVLTIKGWEHPTYGDRFIRPGDPRILYTDVYGRSVLEQDDPDIFVKSVWVQKAKGYGNPYHFGYNLIDAEMNRDRGVVSGWNVNWEAGKIWASVTDVDLLERFFIAVDDGCAENGAQVGSHKVTNRASFELAFKRVHGKWAVVETDKSAADMAEHIGAKPVRIGHALEAAVIEAVGTDGQYIQEMQGNKKVFIPDKKLDTSHKRTLNMLRRLANRAGFGGKVDAYVLEDNILGQERKGNVRISFTQLREDNRAKAVAILLHEMAHAEGAGPGDDIANKIAEIAGGIIVSYAVRK